MKKILLVATSLVALSTVAGAGTESHNYMGGGLGWVMANAKASNFATLELGGGGAPGSSGNVAKRGEDNAPIGKIFLGRSFNEGSINLLTEVSLALDTSNAKGTTSTRVIHDAGNAVSEAFKSSLKRKGILGLSFGLSGNVVRDVLLYGKASLLVARFKASSSASATAVGGVAAAAATQLNALSPFFTNKTAYGFGLTVGASKPVTEKISLGVDYTFEMYQKIKIKGGAIINGYPYAYTGTIKPQYHTIMVSMSTKI